MIYNRLEVRTKLPDVKLGQAIFCIVAKATKAKKSCPSGQAGLKYWLSMDCKAIAKEF